MLPVAQQLTRPTPPHRPIATACEPLPAPSTTQDCVAPNDQLCTTDADCSADARCLASHYFSGSYNCACETNECFVDSDCGEGKLCTCGIVSDGGQGCDFLSGQCMHDCVTADCRTDADCGDGGYCSPVKDGCNNRVLRYACHAPDADECFSDWECGGAYSGEFCTIDLGSTAWTCHHIPVCD